MLLFFYHSKKKKEKKNAHTHNEDTQQNNRILTPQMRLVNHESPNTDNKVLQVNHIHYIWNCFFLLTSLFKWKCSWHCDTMMAPPPYSPQHFPTNRTPVCSDGEGMSSVKVGALLQGWTCTLSIQWDPRGNSVKILRKDFASSWKTEAMW